MKTKYYILSLSLFLSITVKSQNNVNIVFNETSLNNTIDVIKTARGINFGDYLNQNGLNAWFLNLNDAQVDIQPNNTVVINNIIIAGGVDLQLWTFEKTSTGDITGSITGQFSVKGSPSEGYFLHVVPTGTSFTYSGSLQSVINLVAILTNNFASLIPDIEVNIGNSLLPNLTLKYFKSGMPQITTNDSEIILTFEVLFDNLNMKNRTILLGEHVHYTASNSITFESGFSVEKGATFLADITPKSQSNLKSATLSNNKESVIIGDTLISVKELTHDVSQTDNFAPLGNVNVFPNPFMNTLSIKGSEPSILFSITIIDMQGKVVFERKNINQSDKIDLSGLKTGTYVIKYTSVNINDSKQIIKVK
jgi:hypothetical protein